MTELQFLAVVEWQRKTFKESTPLSKLSHMAQELVELATALKENDADAIKKEFAYCFILLFGAADSYGMAYGDICQAIDEKMQINLKRKWGTPDENGVVNHIEFDPCDECDRQDACRDFNECYKNPWNTFLKK